MSRFTVEIGDLFSDETGKRWRVIDVGHNRNVTLEAAERPSQEHHHRARMERPRLEHGIHGLKWIGTQQ